MSQKCLFRNNFLYKSKTTFLNNKQIILFVLFLTFHLSAIAQVPLPNLVYWFKCDSFVVKDNLNNVLGWKNSIDTTKILSNSNLSNSPTFTNNTLHFDGIDDYLDLNFSAISQPISYVVLWKGGISSNAQLVIDGIAANDRNSLIYYSPPFAPSIGIYSGSNLFDYPKSTFNNPIISTLIFDNANSSIYENGNLKVLNQNPGSNGINGLTIGSRFDHIFPLNGDISEILIYNKVLSTIEINSINNYLINKYSKPVNLGADINISDRFCDTILSSLNTFESYLWSNGATTSTISVNQSGNYWLRGIDGFGRVSSDTIKVTFPEINYPLKSSYCKNDTLTWDTGLSKSLFNFIWQDSSTDSLIKISQSGTYSLVITDLSGCSISSNSFAITEDNFPTTTSLGNDTILCAGNSITLTSGYSPSHSYLWSTGSTNDSLLVNIGGQYSVVVTNTNSCIAKDTINVTIQGQAPVANFTTSLGCINSIVNFTDLSVPPSGNTLTAYEWNFGDLSSATNTSTLSNPSHTYTNTGTYTVSLKVISNAGCEQTIRKIIQVFPKPTVNFISGISCQNDSTAFSSLSSSVAGYSITSLNWNFGDPTSVSNISNLSSPKHLFGNQTNYTITLIATNNVGCKDSLKNIIAVRAQVKADFTYSTPCTNTTTIFQDNSIVPPAPNSNIRTWNFGNGPINTLNASKTFTTSGVYSVTLTVSSSNQCSSTISKLVTIFTAPTASFTIPAICSKDTITATNLSVAQSGVISSYNWKLNGVNFSSIQSPSLSISNAGIYPVKLTITNSFGCKDSITNSVTVNALPNVDFITNPTTYYYINSPVNFIPSITDASSYFWDLNGIGTSTVQSPSASYNIEGTYTVTLILKDTQGCKNNVTKTLLVSKRFLDVAILNVNSTKDNDGFMTIQTDIANYGSIPVSSLDLSYKVSDGGNVQETWNGTLNPNSFFSYTFVSKTATQIGSSNNITCVDVKKANGINDQNQTNNELCNVLNTNDITVSNPIPNPTNADITLPIILNKEIDFSVSIYNSNGQIQFEEKTEKGIIGLNLITLPTANYARGCYIIKTEIDDKIFIKKFIKISNE